MGKRIELTKEQENSIIELYNEGHGVPYIVKQCGFSHKVVDRILKENGIVKRDDKHKGLKYTHNENFFEVIDTEEKAYWLGFIYADGYITKPKQSSFMLGITISIKDVEHLELFKKHIEATHPIRRYEAHTQYNSSDYVRIEIKGDKIVQDIQKLGVYFQKTEILTFPTEEQVPQHLLHHFVRGYMDGDGYITTSGHDGKVLKIGFCGTKEFLEGLKQRMDLKDKKLYQKKEIKERGTNNYSLDYSSLQAKNLGTNIYKDATIYLKRKKDIFDKMV